MVEITPRTTGNESRRRLEELPTQPNDVRSSTQRDPVQIDGWLAIYCRFQVPHKFRVDFIVDSHMLATLRDRCANGWVMLLRRYRDRPLIVP